MTICGRSVRSAIALPRPVVEPPPSATVQSARELLDGLQRARGDVDRRMHRRFGEDADAEIAERRGEMARLIDLLRRRQHDRAFAEPAHFVGDLRQRAEAEDDARGMGVIDEVFHQAVADRLLRSPCSNALPSGDPTGRRLVR